LGAGLFGDSNGRFKWRTTQFTTCVSRAVAQLWDVKRTKPHFEFMPSRFGSSGEPTPLGPEKSGDEGGIDSSKRYDVYCHRHGNASLMVYRNVLFKRATPLFRRDDAYGKFGEFVELEQASGQTFFVSRMSIFVFCEHGTHLPVEVISGD
jgi:hypothetical protein